MFWAIFGPILGHFDPFWPKKTIFGQKWPFWAPTWPFFDFLGGQKSKISKIINSHKNTFWTIVGTI